MNKICDTYKRIVDAEILGSFNMEEHDKFNGAALREKVKGAANEYLDEVLQYALIEVEDETVKEEIFELKDRMEVDFEEEFRKYFHYFQETNKDDIIPWSLRQGEELMKGYKKCCMNFLTRAEEGLAKHNVTLDLRRLI